MQIFTKEITEPLFWILEQTKGVIQMDIHHPEGDVFIHSVQTLHCAFRETYDTDLILAAMLHDVGKIGESKGHEQIAVEMLDCHCSPKTLWLIENHMRVWYFILGEMHKLSKVKEMAGHPWLPELIHLARLDKISRNPRRKIVYDRENVIDRLNNCVNEHFGRGNSRGQ